MDFVTVSASSLTSDVAELIVATLDGLRAGYTVTVQGVGAPYDGTQVLTATNTDEVMGATVYTVSYDLVHANIAAADVDGRITPACTWVDSTDVEGFLGVAPASLSDAAYLQSCVDAGNDWAYRRRQSAGYDDWADLVPSADVRLGTIMYAAALYRERGSVDTFASFADMAPLAPIGSNMQVLRLLGLNKPVIA